ncbi:YqgE/AlgH family protein [Chitinophagaceae bacterium LWZ2-11]
MNAGAFITGTSLLDDTFFEKAVILITEYNERGAMGFVINKPFPRKLNELEEFKHGIPFLLHDGGPVDREHIFMLHQRADLIPGGTLIADNIYLGGDFKKAVMHVNDKTITEKDIKLFIGYCGWDSLELESEVAEGSWLSTENVSLF